MSKNLTGLRFGRWVVVKRLSNSKWEKAQWLCLCDCGVERSVASQSLLRGASTSCGCFHRDHQRTIRGSQRVYWKGGSVSKQGYRLIMVAGKQEREHRIVMSEHLGRPLLPHEEVHHKDGGRSNNAIDNLELWSKSHPSGQRVEDKTMWAIEWLRIYAPEVLSNASKDTGLPHSGQIMTGGTRSLV